MSRLPSLLQFFIPKKPVPEEDVVVQQASMVCSKCNHITKVSIWDLNQGIHCEKCGEWTSWMRLGTFQIGKP